jgi:hypothetical protein
MNAIQKELISELTNGPRAVSETSANIYIRNLNTIANKWNGRDYESNNFLLEYPRIEKIISFEYCQATTKNFLNAILAALSPLGTWKYLEGFEIVGRKYGVYQNQVRKVLIAESKKQELSKKEEENWCDESVLVKIRQKKLNWIRHHGVSTISGQIDPILKKDYMDRIQQALVASLYTMIYTNRNAYGNMKVIDMDAYQKLDQEAKEGNNYYVYINLRRAIFSIGDHKNSHKIVDGERIHQGVIITQIPVKLNRIIKIWLQPNHNDTGFFLLNTKGRMLGTAGVTKLINKTFSSTGKLIGSTLCRKIKISKKFENEIPILEKEQIAKDCGHSVSTQSYNYTKKNISFKITEKKT